MMMTDQEQLEIKTLLELNHSGKISAAQSARLLAYMETYWAGKEDYAARPAPSDVFQAFMEKAWREAVNQKEDPLSENDRHLAPNIDWEQMYRQITQDARAAVASGPGTQPVEKPASLPLSGRKKIKAMIRFKWVAAAVLLFAIGLGGWWVIKRQEPGTAQVRPQKTADLPAPGSARAILVLADGKEVAIDSAANGAVADLANTDVVLSGHNTLRYAPKTGAPGGEIQYNELRVLKGSQPVQITLSDGSSVWLNVGSSLRYPIVFAGDSREVTLTGEAYFEVHHESKRLFIVHHDDLAVKVLGTHFNVNSYPDEPDLKVTLLQGAVEVDQKGQHLLLHPGQQAVAGARGASTLILNKKVDVDQVLSWKSSEFIFGPDTDFKAVMRQIARWYDVEVSYTGEIRTRFWGALPRTETLQGVLQLLEATGGVRFQLTGRQLKVMPAR